MVKAYFSSIQSRLKALDAKQKVIVGSTCLIFILFLGFAIWFTRPTTQAQSNLTRMYAPAPNSSVVTTSEPISLVAEAERTWPIDPFAQSREVAEAIGQAGPGSRVPANLRPEAPQRMEVTKPVVRTEIVRKPRPLPVEYQPTLRPATSTSKPASDRRTLSVTHIYRKDGRYSAVVLGREVQVGETVEGYKVVYISSGRVLLKNGSESLTLVPGGD